MALQLEVAQSTLSYTYRPTSLGLPLYALGPSLEAWRYWKSASSRVTSLIGLDEAVERNNVRVPLNSPLTRSVLPVD